MDLSPWQPGTDVSLYPRVSELHMDDMPPPAVAAIATATVTADRSLAFNAVPDGSYWAIAPIGGRVQYVAVFAQDGFVPV